MKKFILFLILVGFLFSCSQIETTDDEVIPGKAIDWTMVELGYKVNIVKTTTDVDTLFDYSEFHFGERDENGVIIYSPNPFEVKYFNEATVNMDIVIKADYWDLIQDGNIAKEIAETNKFKQTVMHSINTAIDWDRQVTSTNITFSGSGKGPSKILFFKGLNDGTGTVELVGYITSEYGVTKEVGDCNFDTPMVQ